MREQSAVLKVGLKLTHEFGREGDLAGFAFLADDGQIPKPFLGLERFDFSLFGGFVFFQMVQSGQGHLRNPKPCDRAKPKQKPCPGYELGILVRVRAIEVTVDCVNGFLGEGAVYRGLFVLTSQFQACFVCSLSSFLQHAQIELRRLDPGEWV